MTNQIQGEILYAGWAGDTAANRVYTPWMPVRGDLASYGIEVMRISGLTLTWNVETRTLEDPTTSTLLSDQAATGLGLASAVSTTSAKQLVRYRFSTGSTVNITDFVVFRALQPSWQGDR